MIYKPTLVVMAAGMGSRYGGLKQIDPISDRGEIILDFSLYDAMLAGFEEVVFIIKKANEADFRALIDERAGSRLNVHYAFQDVNDIPPGYEVPAGREKPWGTGHAVLAARDIVGGPFAVINADDYYGSAAFQHMYDFLVSADGGASSSACGEAADTDGCAGGGASSSACGEAADTDGCAGGGAELYSMVAFRLSNTLSESGHVARGVCKVSEDGKLLDIHERTMIKRLSAEDAAGAADNAGCGAVGVGGATGGQAGAADNAGCGAVGVGGATGGQAGAADNAGAIGYSEDGGETWTLLAEDTPVSMNFWGFTNSFMKELEARFPAFLDKVPGVKKDAPTAQDAGPDPLKAGPDPLKADPDPLKADPDPLKAGPDPLKADPDPLKAGPDPLKADPDPLKAEYFLPGVVDQLLKEGKSEVKVLRSSDKWYGVTYKEDKDSVVDALRSMKDKGIYPEVLWG